MFIGRVCLWLLLAVPAWTQSHSIDSQMRLHIPVWDMTDIYSRITKAFQGPQKNQNIQKIQKAEVEVDHGQIDDYYNNYWENYYYHNPPYVPQPTRRPRPTRRPNPMPTRRPRRTTTTTRVPLTTSTTMPPETTLPTTTAPPETTTPTLAPAAPVTILSSPETLEDYDFDGTQEFLKPEQHLSIRSPPQPLNSLCHYYRRLCTESNEAQFTELTDGIGNPVILISLAQNPITTSTPRPSERSNRESFNQHNRINHNRRSKHPRVISRRRPTHG